MRNDQARHDPMLLFKTPSGSGAVDLVRFTNPKRQRGKHFTRKGRRNLFASLALRVNIRTVSATSKLALRVGIQSTLGSTGSVNVKVRF